MAERVGHEGHPAATGSAGQTLGDEAAALPVEARSRATFEHEAAALDLSEAEQLSAWSAAMAEQGDVAESQRLANRSSILYESAKRRRLTAERLERELEQGQ